MSRECVILQWVHKPVDLWDTTFCCFEALSSVDTRRFWGSELSSIEQTATADPNSQRMPCDNDTYYVPIRDQLFFLSD